MLLAARLPLPDSLCCLAAWPLCLAPPQWQGCRGRAAWLANPIVDRALPRPFPPCFLVLPVAETRALEAMQRKPEGSLQAELEALPPPPVPAPPQQAQQAQQPRLADSAGMLAAAQAAAAQISAQAVQGQQASAAAVLQAMLPPQPAPPAEPWAAGTVAQVVSAPPPPPPQQHPEPAAMDVGQ